MYFKSRTEAGKLLGRELAKVYQGKSCAVVALDEGGVMVGAQIALELKAVLTMLLVEPVELPGENEPIGALSETGAFVYNNMYTPGEIEGLMMDFRGMVEDEKRSQLSHMHRLVGGGDSLRLELMRHKYVLLVSDGFSNGYSIDIAIEVLKPIVTKNIIAAAPVMSPQAADRIRVLCDRMFYLSVADNYLSTGHYYETDDVPAREDVVGIVKELAGQWK